MQRKRWEIDPELRKQSSFDHASQANQMLVRSVEVLSMGQHLTEQIGLADKTLANKN